MIEIQIKFKSFEQILIQNNLIYLKNIAEFVNCNFFQSLSLPQKIKKMTVIRSPHIDKKSREQFELKTFKYLVVVKFTNKKTARLFIEILKNSSFPGTQIEIYIKSLNFYRISNKI